MYSEVFIFLLSFALICGIICPAKSIETNTMRAPVMPIVTTESIQSDSYVSDVFQSFMMVYRQYVSPVISRGCPSYPTCSQYMTIAVQTLGVPTGIVVGIGRLLHESGEIHYGSIVHIDNEHRIYDPLQNNTFWWRSNGTD